jgi:hypothetical protein
MEKFVEHESGRAARPGIVPPGFDRQLDISEEPIEAVCFERIAQRRQQEIEEFRSLAPDDYERGIEDVDNGCKGEPERVAG